MERHGTSRSDVPRRLIELGICRTRDNRNNEGEETPRSVRTPNAPGGCANAASETRDGKKSYDAGPHSSEMQKLNKRFGMMHGVSSLVNMAALLATVVYGGTLAEMLR